jgi:protein associated with RNAse G/E
VKPGDTIWVRTAKADGRPHRWWPAQVESVEDDCIVVYSAIGSPIHHNPDRFPAALYHRQHTIRSYYWPGRRHNLLEIYAADGRLVELYADITSPVEVGENEIVFTDHELDVSQLAGEAPRIVDQDEFAEAAVAYGYSDEFMHQCYELAEALLEVLANWQPRGASLIETGFLPRNPVSTDSDSRH